jgi:hypothetical protein
MEARKLARLRIKATKKLLPEISLNIRFGKTLPCSRSACGYATLAY